MKLSDYQLKSAIVILILWLIFSWSTIVSADAPRFDFNDMGYFQAFDIYSLAQGEFDLIALPFYQSNQAFHFASVSVGFQYGVTNRMLLFGVYGAYNYLQIPGSDPLHGRGDIFLGGKYSFFNIKNSNNSAALIFSMQIPSGDLNKGISDGLMRYFPAIALAHDFPHKTWNGQLFTDFGVVISSRARGFANPVFNPPLADFMNIDVEQHLGRQRSIIVLKSIGLIMSGITMAR